MNSYIFMLELSYISMLAFIVYHNWGIYYVVRNVLLLQNGLLGTEYSLNAPSWCISITFVCYVLFYFVVAKAKSLKRVYGIFSIFAISGCILIASGLNYPVLNEQIGRGLASFSIGVLLYGIYQMGDKVIDVKIAYFCMAALLAMYCFYRFGFLSVSEHYLFVMILLIAPMIMICVLYIPWIGDLLGKRAFGFLGLISMEVYLLHFPVQCCIKLFEVGINYSIDYTKCTVWFEYIVITVIVAVLYHFALSKIVNMLFRKVFN